MVGIREKRNEIPPDVALESELSRRYGPIRFVSMPMGDVHDEGSSVRKYTFCDDTTVFVKPRNPNRDILISEITREYNEFFGRTVVDSPRSVSVLGHSIQEQTDGELSSIPSPDSMYNAGHAAYLCSLLNIVDQHCENVLWCSSIPVLCDVEAGALERALRIKMSGAQCLKSTGWMDTTLLEQKMSPTGLEFVRVGQKRLLAALYEGAIDAKKTLEGFVEDSARTDLISTFLSEPYRVILAHTSTYTSLLKLLRYGDENTFNTHYEYMNMNRSMRLLDFLPNLALWQIREYELDCLKSGYTPRFEYCVSEHSLIFGGKNALLAN